LQKCQRGDDVIISSTTREEEIALPFEMRTFGSEKDMKGPEIEIRNQTLKIKCQETRYDLLRYNGNMELWETRVCRFVFLLTCNIIGGLGLPVL